MILSKPLLKSLLLLLFFILHTEITAQNLFKEKFEGCNTDRFGTEKDSIKVKSTTEDIIYILSKNLKKKHSKKIKGLLSLQIIVDVEGTSCLLSVDNETNISTKKLNLKAIIDQYLTWQKPTKKTSVMIAMMFDGKKVEKKRIGMSSEKGFHPID